MRFGSVAPDNVCNFSTVSTRSPLVDCSRCQESTVRELTLCLSRRLVLTLTTLIEERTWLNKSSAVRICFPVVLEFARDRRELIEQLLKRQAIFNGTGRC